MSLDDRQHQQTSGCSCKLALDCSAYLKLVPTWRSLGAPLWPNLTSCVIVHACSRWFNNNQWLFSSLFVYILSAMTCCITSNQRTCEQASFASQSKSACFYSVSIQISTNGGCGCSATFNSSVFQRDWSLNGCSLAQFDTGSHSVHCCTKQLILVASALPLEAQWTSKLIFCWQWKINQNTEPGCCCRY